MLANAPVIGRPFSSDDVATLSTQMSDPTSALERLVDSNCLAKTTDSLFVFSHPLFPEVVSNNAHAQAQVWHGRLALALVESSREMTAESCLGIVIFSCLAMVIEVSCGAQGCR